MSVTTYSTDPTSTRGTFSNGSDLFIIPDNGTVTTELTWPIEHKGSAGVGGNRFLWVPGAIVGIAMLIFLGVSFYRYHRRYRRKRKVAMEYVSRALNVNRPRIGTQGCFTNNYNLQLYELSDPVKTCGHLCDLPNGNEQIKNIPVSVKIPLGTSNTFPNPVFQNDTAGESGSRLTVVNADIHSAFGDREAINGSPFPTLNGSQYPPEVELRLSQLCQHCVNKVLSTTNQTRTPVKCHIDSDLGEYRLKGYDPGDDYAMMDAFHGRPQPRERRRPSVDTSTPRYKFGFKDNKKLCPYCFAWKPVTSILV